MSFFEKLTKIGVESIKDGVLGYDDHEDLKKKIAEKWEAYDGPQQEAIKKTKDRNFFFWWKFTLDESYDRCLPTAEQVEAALPDELKINGTNPYDKVMVEANICKTPIEYSVCYKFEHRVNEHFEEASKKRKREEGEGENKENKEEEEAEKPGPEHWGHVSPDTCERRVEQTPTAALNIMENALAGLGYNVENLDDSVALGAAWKRALENEINKEASKAFKQALVDVVAKHPEKAPAIQEKLEAAKAQGDARRADEASR